MKKARRRHQYSATYIRQLGELCDELHFELLNSRSRLRILRVETIVVLFVDIKAVVCAAANASGEKIAL